MHEQKYLHLHNKKKVNSVSKVNMSSLYVL